MLLVIVSWWLWSYNSRLEDRNSSNKSSLSKHFKKGAFSSDTAFLGVCLQLQCIDYAGMQASGWKVYKHVLGAWEFRFKCNLSLFWSTVKICLFNVFEPKIHQQRWKKKKGHTLLVWDGGSHDSCFKVNSVDFKGCTSRLNLSVFKKPCGAKLFLNVLSWVISLIQITSEVCSPTLTPRLDGCQFLAVGLCRSAGHSPPELTWLTQ